jgi:hypothetical protein
VFDMNSQQQRIFSSPRYQFFHRRHIDFFIAGISIFSLPRYQFFLRLTAIIDFSSPHGDINFSLPHGNNQFFLRLTAIIDSSSPYGDNLFFLCLTAIIDFFFDSR